MYEIKSIVNKFKKKIFYRMKSKVRHIKIVGIPKSKQKNNI